MNKKSNNDNDELSLRSEIEEIRDKLLEQEHRTINIIGQMISPPPNWSDGEKKANKRAFYWAMARFFIPGLGAGSGTGLIAIASLALLGFQAFSLNTQTYLLAAQTKVISEELQIRRQEIESLRPILAIVPRRNEKTLRLANKGTREARIESIEILADGFSKELGDIKGFAPFYVWNRSIDHQCSLRLTQRMKEDVFLYPIKHEGSREKALLMVRRVCSDDVANEWDPVDYLAELKSIEINICYCMQDRDICWILHGNWYQPPTGRLSTESVTACT